MSQDGGLEKTTDDALGDPDELVGAGDERKQAAEAEQMVEGDTEGERVTRAAQQVADERSDPAN